MSVVVPNPARRGVLARIALKLLHVLIAVQQLVADRCLQLQSFLLAVLERHFPSISRYFTSQRPSRGKQPAFPTRIAIVVAEKWSPQTSLDRIASLIRWCSAVGLLHIQVYDQAGEAKQAAFALNKRLNFSRGSAYDVRVGFRDEGCESQNGKRRRDGSGETTVHLLDRQDAVNPILSAAATGRAKDGRDRPETTEADSVSSSFLTSEIQQAAGDGAIQQPDLVLVFGPVLTLAGFPPWLARHSEIYCTGQLADAQEGMITNAIAHFCRTSQRFGT